MSWGELVLMNRKLSDDIQRLLKAPLQSQDFELYKTAAHVLTSEYAKYNTPLPKFFEESEELLCKVWEEPLSHDHPYGRKLYAEGPKGQNRFPSKAIAASPYFHKEVLQKFQQDSLRSIHGQFR